MSRSVIRQLGREVRRAQPLLAPLDPTPQPPPPPRIPWPWIMSGVGIALLVILALIALAFTGARNETNRVESQLATQIAAQALQATPTCVSASRWLDTIRAQEQSANYATAASNAAIALTSADLCPQDKAMLANHYVSDGQRAILARPAAYDRASQQRVADEMTKLRQEAERYGVPFPSYYQIADEARSRSWFLLSIQSWETAYRRGEVNANDLEQIRLYQANLHDLGAYYVRGGSITYQEGLALLVAAHRLDIQFHLGNGLAGGALRRLLGEDEQDWPQPTPSPLWQ